MLQEDAGRRGVPRRRRCPASPASSSPRCWPGSRARRRWSSSPRTTSTPSTPSSSTPSTTCSSRCARSGCAEAVRRVVRAARRRAGAGARTTRSPVELGGVTRFVARSRGPLRRGAGRLRPAAHRRRQPPDPGAAEPRSRRSGPTPASSGSTARCWSRCRTSSEVRMDAGRCTVVVGRRGAAGQPAAHPRAARPARAPGPTGWAASHEPEAGTGRPRAGPGDQPADHAGVPGAGSRSTSEIDAQTPLGEIYMSLAAARPAAAGRAGDHHRRGRCSAGCRCCSG